MVNGNPNALTIESFRASGAGHPWPAFRHDPDPLRSQTIEVSLDACTVCHEHRGFLAVGHPWATEDFHTVCPWCIEGGRAHKEYGAKFTADIVPRPGTQPAPEAYAEIQQRTPRFVGLQGDDWYTCCEDGMAYLGRLFGAGLREAPAAVLEASRKAESLVSYDSAEREETSLISPLTRA
jgi:uncharacterized protein CbrC (UPF0167 family)